MRKKTLIGLTAVLLFTAGVIQAGDDKAQNILNQNLSKRPYQEAPAESVDNKGDNWEAATLVKDQATKQKSGPSNYQQLRIRMLGQRPYMEKSTD